MKTRITLKELLLTCMLIFTLLIGLQLTVNAQEPPAPAPAPVVTPPAPAPAPVVTPPAPNPAPVVVNPPAPNPAPVVTPPSPAPPAPPAPGDPGYVRKEDISPLEATVKKLQEDALKQKVDARVKDAIRENRIDGSNADQVKYLTRVAHDDELFNQFLAATPAKEKAPQLPQSRPIIPQKNATGSTGDSLTDRVLADLGM